MIADMRDALYRVTLRAGGDQQEIFLMAPSVHAAARLADETDAMAELRGIYGLQAPKVVGVELLGKLAT